jgi:multiple sugar transport system permease protein
MSALPATPGPGAGEVVSSSGSFWGRVTNGPLGGYVLLAPAVIVILLLTVWPLIFNVAISLTDLQGGSGSEVSFVGLDNYIKLIQDPLFTGSIVTTASLVIVAVPLQLAFAYVAARILVRTHQMIGTRILRTLFILPTMMTSLAVALFWRYILDAQIGVANYVLKTLGLPTSKFLSEPNTAFISIVFMYLWQWIPFAAMLLMAGLLGIPRAMYEAASIDGATWAHRIRYIDIPQLRRVFAIGGILALVEVIRMFDLIYGSTNGGPGTATLTVSVQIYRSAFQNFTTGYAAACALLVLVVTILVSQLFVRATKEDEVKS